MSIASIDRPPADIQWSAARVLADFLAWGLALFRPITQHTEEVYEDDGHGGETLRVVSSPNVFVFPLRGASALRVAACIERAADESCITVRILGCQIELFYESKRAGSSRR